MKRGDIYLIRRRDDAVGSEIKKARPGVLVSCDALNNTSGVVEVVYLTTQPRRDLPSHAHTARRTGVLSHGCEQVDSVSVYLLGERIARLSAEEMQAVDQALQCSLGLHADPEEEASEVERLSGALAAVTAERDRYAAIIDRWIEEGCK